MARTHIDLRLFLFGRVLGIQRVLDILDADQMRVGPLSQIADRNLIDAQRAVFESTVPETAPTYATWILELAAQHAARGRVIQPDADCRCRTGRLLLQHDSTRRVARMPSARGGLWSNVFE